MKQKDLQERLIWKEAVDHDLKTLDTRTKRIDLAVIILMISSISTWIGILMISVKFSK